MSEVEMLCIGGPNAGYTAKAPREEYHRLLYVGAIKPPTQAPSRGLSKAMLRTHTYTVRSYFSENNKQWALVHHSVRRDWLGYVLERYAKRHRRPR